MNSTYILLLTPLIFSSIFSQENIEEKKIAEPILSLFEAARLGNLQKAQEHILQKTDVNAVDADGYTPLMYAAASLTGFEDTLLPIVRKLLAAGANPNVKTQSGETAFTLVAAFPNHIKIAQELIKNGADVNVVIQETGMTPLMTAAANNNMPLVKILARKVDNIDQATPAGITALMFAAQDGQPEMVVTLLKAGADRNATDNEGNSALIGAARTYLDLRDAQDVEQAEKNRYLQVITQLIKAGADRKLKNSNDMSFDDYAQKAPELAQTVRMGNTKTPKKIMKKK